jgi:putative transposase
MPWDEASPMQQRARFLVEFSSCLYTMSELCRRYGISRKTGYKWAERFAEGGVAEFQDRPRRPKSCPHRTPPEIESALLEFRKRHPRWGPRKLLVRLEERSPEIEWPAASTIGDLLKRHGLVTARRFRPRPSRAPLTPLSEPRQANDLWTTDFKGQFRLGDGRWCYPLTVADAASRYLLAVTGLDSTQEVTAWPIFEDLFREYGLPAAIRSDNGSPFASVALGRLSRLSVRWLKLGIRLERIAPGHPEQNGAHERMHRTLKDETARPPAATASAQQACFDAFRQEYNEERPHEALGQRTPASRYRSSRRRYPKRPPEPQYPGHFEVRSVRSDGQIKWQGAYLFVSEALAGERVGLEETRDGEWSISFGAMLLGRFDAKERKVYG